MFPSRCRSIWDEGGIAHAICLHITEPRVSEIAAEIGWDCIWIDLEHHPKTLRELEVMSLALRSGSFGRFDGPPDIMARPGKGEFMQLGRLLECGAGGIMYPRCESAEEARQAAHWTRFSPMGARGFDGGNIDNRYGSYPAGNYVEKANANTWLAVQVESPAAVEQAQAMAEVEGVDMLFFGPGDYSCLTGKPGQIGHPDVLKAMTTTARAALKAGKRFGTLALTPETRRIAMEEGCQLVACGADQTLLRNALTAFRQAMRDEVAALRGG